ncbi:TetR/AcrR family transcriptional regulator [Novosphingobium album (ex Liu et al. 2023)]|uniref:Helix-turn-helix domain containing protein n=1 Tax=Novosphingobium album (ex Liu et al. 2023) TaxID=3031130 RepID=A0ABT5WPL3_9SPHN|nr:TetR/AcrR family transcriptional regulator [Novosphingobium album (ex Liu et al. 2023)]MDE8651996.1 helix-turn-helix domain containing protein [Novosphingobium album (ex Liu et al. 2023)]
MSNKEVSDIAPAPRRPDARAIRSKEALRQSLRALMAERPFKQITIKDITSHAGVSYPVFFRQFRNIEDIFNDIAVSEVDAMLEFAMLSFHEGDASSEQMCRYLMDNRVIWQSLFAAGASPTMRERFARRGIETARTFGQRRPEMPLELAATIVSGAIFEALGWWLRQPDDFPIATIQHVLDTFVIEPANHRLALLIARELG